MDKDIQDIVDRFKASEGIKKKKKKHSEQWLIDFVDKNKKKKEKEDD